METMPKVLSLAFPNLKYSVNKTELYYEFPNGSIIMLGGLDDGPRVEKILGSEASTLWINEASQVDLSSVHIAISRLAEKNDLKKRIWFDFNPPARSHWSYLLFEKKIDPLSDSPLVDPENYQSFRMNPSHNAEHIDKDYLAMLDKMPEKERNRFMLGEYNDETGGQVYYSFKRDDHTKQIEKQPGTIFLAMDFNVAPFTAIVFQFLNNSFYVLDEIFLMNADTYKMCAELKARGYAGLKVIPDSTGGNRKTSGKSDFDILKENGFQIETTFNPFVQDRVNNVNRLFTSDKIFIDPKCKKLVNDLERVVWKDNKLDQSGSNKMLTHVSDCLGYACWKLSPINPITQKMSSYQR